MFAATLLLLAQAAPAARAPAPVAPAPAAQPVAPVASPEQGDARCLAAFGMLGSSDQAEVQRAAQLGALYFYGKLLGRNPGIDLKAAMLGATRLIGTQPRPELVRCGAELQKSGEAMQAVGNAMAPAAAPAGPAPARPAPTATPAPRR